jgi:hypothetical protein
MYTRYYTWRDSPIALGILYWRTIGKISMSKSSTRLLYEQTAFPIFQNRIYLTAGDAKSCTRGDIRIVEDLESGLIYNSAFRPELMEYDEHYQNEQGVSLHFQAHLDSVAEIIARAIGTDHLVEVGCGKGLFLERLLQRGMDVVGFDPAYEGSSPRVKKEYFGASTDVTGRGLILRHVLEHIPDPVDFISKLSEANGGKGLIYIEVPCFDWICERRAWFDIFYEHVNYFRICDLKRMFSNIVECGHTFGGQYIYVVAELNSIHRPIFDVADQLQFPADFSDALIMRNEQELASGVVWGAGSKGVIFALMHERAGLPVKTIVDINPAKQNRHIAVTGIKVQSPSVVLPELMPNTPIFVMNSNYLDEITEMSGGLHNYITIDGG